MVRLGGDSDPLEIEKNKSNLLLIEKYKTLILVEPLSLTWSHLPSFLGVTWVSRHVGAIKMIG